MPAQYNNIDEYITLFPPEVRAKLDQLRAVIRAAAPDATEKISYQMPTFYLQGNLVHFAAFKDHISLFPAPTGIDAYAHEIAPYRTGKGTLQFPLDQPIPFDLVSRIVKFRVSENLARAKRKKK